jgi:hypothetical protein
VKDSITSTFDYAALAIDTRKIVKQKTTEIRDRIGHTAKNIVEIGERLLEVKNFLEHGQFGAWLTAEFEWTDRTARKMMSVAMHFKSEPGSDLRIAPAALYLLASPSTPEAVREKFIADAQNGKTVTRAEVKQAIKPEAADEPDVPDEEEADEPDDHDWSAPEGYVRADDRPPIKPNHPEPQMWNGRTIPANVPPFDLDVSNEPAVLWSRWIRDVQGCIARLPDKASLKSLPDAKRKYIVERLKGFSNEILEAV